MRGSLLKRNAVQKFRGQNRKVARNGVEVHGGLTSSPVALDNQPASTSAQMVRRVRRRRFSVSPISRQRVVSARTRRQRSGGCRGQGRRRAGGFLMCCTGLRYNYKTSCKDDSGDGTGYRPSNPSQPDDRTAPLNLDAAII